MCAVFWSRLSYVCHILVSTVLHGPQVVVPSGIDPDTTLPLVAPVDLQVERDPRGET